MDNHKFKIACDSLTSLNTPFVERLESAVRNRRDCDENIEVWKYHGLLESLDSGDTDMAFFTDGHMPPDGRFLSYIVSIDRFVLVCGSEAGFGKKLPVNTPLLLPQKEIRYSSSVMSILTASGHDASVQFRPDMTSVMNELKDGGCAAILPESIAKICAPKDVFFRPLPDPEAGIFLSAVWSRRRPQYLMEELAKALVQASA